MDSPSLVVSPRHWVHFRRDPAFHWCRVVIDPRAYGSAVMCDCCFPAERDENMRVFYFYFIYVCTNVARNYQHVDCHVARPCRCYKEILSAEEDRVETGLARDDMEATGVDFVCLSGLFTSEPLVLYPSDQPPS